MALEFRPPPDWLVQEYINRKTPVEQASQGLQAAIGTYLTIDEAKRKNALAKQQIDTQNRELGMRGKEQFYNYGDPTGLPPEAQSAINDPVQGPPTESGQGPQLSPIVAYFKNFSNKFPQGIKGDPSFHQVNQPAPPKPQLRMNQFTGEQEWYLPPTTNGQGPQVIKPQGAPHGPGTFRDISKASADAGEQNSLVSSVISELDRIEPLNKNSRGGIGGALLQRGQSALNMGTDSAGFTNTADVINTLKAQVSRVLKSTFGGQLSDPERAYLNEVYGAVERMTPAERSIAITNVRTMLKGKARAAQAKLNTLSTGAMTPVPGLPSSSGASGPHGQSITQNGFTYTWNPATNTYE